MKQHRRRTTRRALGAGIVALLGLATTVGLVGTAGATSHATKGPKHGAAKAVTTAQVTFSATVTGASSPPTVTGNGAVDFATDAASLAVTIPASLATLIPGGTDAPEVVNVVLSAGTVYLEVPGLASLVGTPWVSVALPSSVTAALPKDFSKAAACVGDVHAILAYAQKHHGTVTSLGTSMVDGVNATGNQITATLKGKGGSSPALSATVWADSSDRLVQGNLSATGAGVAGALNLSATVNLSDYDAPVTITVPPSSEVTPIPYSVLAAVLGQGAGHRRVG
jgi:hypothetical protein